MLDEFEAETGQPALVRKCGYRFVLTRGADVAAFKRNVALQHSLGVTTEWLSGDEVRRMLPLCAFPDALAGTFYDRDGLADPNSVVMGYINAARRARWTFRCSPSAALPRAARCANTTWCEQAS
jgi:sarcosine oxidase subunit beta